MKAALNVVLSILLVGCGAPAINKLDLSENQLGCQGITKKYNLALYWNEHEESRNYDLHISEGFPVAEDTCGSWINEKGQRLGVRTLSHEPITLMLQLPITDNSWLLRAVSISGEGVSGLFLHETWGVPREVGTFELKRP